MAEPIRLVIWDLDEVFWKGTLSEGGIQYVQKHHDLVVALARRGIMSSICSKNDMNTVQQLLEDKGVWNYFIFPSVSWGPKGPRLAKLIKDVQLRPSTIVFIDDNPANRNEALHFVPGLQIADEKIIPTLLENPLFEGKDDAKLTRLAQYKVLEARAVAKTSTEDNIDFLRKSNIRVTIEYDIDKYIDRAIELINRTNQLNFTKLRLSENLETARAELRAFLAGVNTQAGLVHVSDDYGDYGFAGFYAMHVHTWWAYHFCFSCRTLGMGIEAWLFERLGRPRLIRASGGTAPEPAAPRRPIDWINQSDVDCKKRSLLLANNVLVRGGCDVQAIMHYLGPVTNELVGEFPFNRGGRTIAIDHTIFLRYALDGMSSTALRAAQSLGYQAEDFSSKLAETPGSFDAYVLSFWADGHYALYCHRDHNVMLPFPVPRRNNGNDIREISGSEIMACFPTADDHRAFNCLVSDFEYESISMNVFEESARRIFQHIPGTIPIFVLLGLESVPCEDGTTSILHHIVNLNRATKNAAVAFKNVHLLPINQFIDSGKDLLDAAHFGRLAYFRMYQKIEEVLCMSSSDRRSSIGQ
jgi:FkbH-like protein